MLGLGKQSRLNRKLRRAAASGDIAGMEEALKAGAEIEAKDLLNGMSPLNKAAWNGRDEAVRYLVEKGANIETKDRWNETPLANALRHAHEGMALFLLDHGANPNVKTEGRKVIAYARHLELTSVVNKIQPPPPPEPKPEPPPRSAATPDEVVFFRQHGNRLLEETFNFAARERITLLRNGMDGPVEAMTRESFDVIGDQAALRHAFELYRQKGGKREEREIFPDSLGKPRLQAGGP